MQESFFKKKENRPSDNTQLTAVDISNSLEESFKEKHHPLLSDPDVQELLSSENRDAARVVADNEPDKIDKLISAAEKVLAEFGECASDGSNCGVDTSEWEEYFGTGAPPLHNALLRALGILEVNKAEADPELLISLMKAPSFSLSYAAASMALDRAEDLEAQADILKNSRKLQNKARALFLEKYANQAMVDEIFIEELSWSVNTKSDSYTRAEVLSRIDQMNLDQEQFRFIAFQACRGVTVVDEENRRAKVENLLYRKSQDMGFDIAKSQICTLPDESAED